MILSNEDKLWIDSVWNKIDSKLKIITIKSRNKIPYSTINGQHDDMSQYCVWRWTNGFFGAMMWLMYVATHNDEYKKTSLNQEKLLDKAFDDYMRLEHDVGFMWHILAGANYRITGDKKAYNKNLYAASVLASRYNIDGGYIRAWNADNQEGYTIIDTMMNLPLLYWASEQVKDDRFKRIAVHHADMVLRDHLRDDGSVNHIVVHNTETGEKIKVLAGQGYSDTSSWTRGIAWAVYGCILSYKYTKKTEYLNAAIKSADYFISNCRENGYRTVIDFRAPKEPIYHDSTAGVCAASAILEIAKYVKPDKSKYYVDTAIKILKVTDELFCDYTDNEDSIVQMGSELYPGNMSCVHLPLIYGDFFFTEAIYKLKGNEFLIW